MNKKLIWKIFLILLPICAVGLGTTMDSVAIYNIPEQTSHFQSYLDLGPEGTLQFAPVLTMLLGCASAILAVIYGINQKRGILRSLKYVAISGAIVAVLPIYMSGDIRMIPNCVVPILLMLQWGLAAYLNYREKKGLDMNTEVGPRLEIH